MSKDKFMAKLIIHNEQGEEMLIYVLHEFEVGGDKIILYVESVDSEEVIPAKLITANDDEYALADIDEDEMPKVESEFERFLDELEEQDDEDFDETGDYDEKFAVELGEEDEKDLN